MDLLTVFLLIVVVVLVILPPEIDPAIMWKDRNERRRKDNEDV